MLEHLPSPNDLEILIGKEFFCRWLEVREAIEQLYETETAWNSGGKSWVYEYKYRRGGKTLCTFYMRENEAGLLIIFGKAEREKFENSDDLYSCAVQKIYENSTTYHDGKWMLFPLDGSVSIKDFLQLLSIKRRPNRK